MWLSLMPEPTTAALGMRGGAAVHGFVDLYDAARAAHLGQQAARAHGFTQPVRGEPCGLVADLEHAMQLVAGDALLGASKAGGRPVATCAAGYGRT